ncbi:MAG: hypothetical protein M1320_01755 [Patescibacteria group bacterium]|nr:hypothetical protein [Patescibacteria group bacterium]
MDKIILNALQPVIAFLQKQGLWDGLVSTWDKLSSLTGSLVGGSGLGSLFGGSGGSGNSSSFIVSFFKLVVAILVTIVNVLIDIVNWALGLFK